MDYICDHCKKQVKCKMQPSRDMLFDCGMYEKRKSPTNADRIRAMSDEKLADFLEEFEACDVCKYYDKNRCTFENPCVHEFAGTMIYEWLKKGV